MSDEHWKLLEQDYGDAWSRLPEAPPLLPRRKSAQITLRIAAGRRARIKAVAAARSLPYHALARSWLINALRAAPPRQAPSSHDTFSEQLNLKLDQDTLDQLKRSANEMRRPYHALAREYLDVALSEEEARLGLDPSPAQIPDIKELMVLLLHAPNSGGRDAVRGMTRLQKLLFVLERHITSEPKRFYAYNYGPFDENVNDAVHSLQIDGYLETATPEPRDIRPGPPSFDEMMAGARKRSGPREEPIAYALNARGHRAAEQLIHSSQASQRLFEAVKDVREQWDTPDLLERVYAQWPTYTNRSLIRDDVAERRARRRKRGSG